MKFSNFISRKTEKLTKWKAPFHNGRLYHVLLAYMQSSPAMPGQVPEAVGGKGLCGE